MTVRELILLLLSLKKEDWDKKIEMEGCDCWAELQDIEIAGNTVLLERR
jgi:hypothetical protein